MKLTRRIASVAVVVILFAATTTARADAFAAIAYSQSTGQYGYTYGYDNLGAAQNDAVANANAGDAQVIVWVENGYAALAVNNNGSWGYGWSTNCQADANNFALNGAGGPECGAHILCWVASGS